jgi:hypothetical protein
MCQIVTCVHKIVETRPQRLRQVVWQKLLKLPCRSALKAAHTANCFCKAPNTFCCESSRRLGDLTGESGRREAPRAARASRLAPVSSRPPINRTLGFPQSGWKRAPISDRVPHRVRGDGLLDQPSCRRQVVGWLAAFAAARGHDHEARSHTGTAPRRVIAASGTTPSRSCKRRPRSPRGPLLGRGCVVLAVIAHTTSAASLEPSRRLPVSRLYAESLPYGRVLAGLQTFPTLRHRSFPWCHCLYAGEPCGCMYPIPSPQTLAFALF